MYTIQANPTGTRSIQVTEKDLQTIEKYALFQHLIDSNGIVDESVLEKLRLNIRSLIAAQEADCKDLLDLCIDVIYHKDMKAFGLHQLILLYIKWEEEEESEVEQIENSVLEAKFVAKKIKELIEDYCKEDASKIQSLFDIIQKF